MTNTLAKGILLAWDMKVEKLFNIPGGKSEQFVKDEETVKILFTFLNTFLSDDGMSKMIQSFQEVMETLEKRK
jgi:hypothetical protein